MGVDVEEKNVHARNQQERGVNRLLRAREFDKLYITRSRSVDRCDLGRVCKGEGANRGRSLSERTEIQCDVTG